MKTEGRENHRWGQEDEYNICQCMICGIHRGKKSNSTFTMRALPGSKGRWHYQYSKGGTKWSDEVPPCK